MSLTGSWPSWAGLPELNGEAREKKNAELLDMCWKSLKQGDAQGPAPIDCRIEKFLTEHLSAVREGKPVKLPSMLSLPKYGMARTLSLPHNGNKYESVLLKSYRCHNGVLHNPVNDKRTTVGVFHVATGSLPVAADKKEVPLSVYSKMLDVALHEAPDENLVLPFTCQDPEPQKAWVKLHLRPMVCPEVPGFVSEKRMETRLMAPGSMVANVDFVESVFGNAGEASLCENDATLQPDSWSGHTGCIILAPHLLRLTKKELGLPHWDVATDRQRRDSMAWKDPNEKYNNGGAFKICARHPCGAFVTMIADNYFGYCKKEVKTQLSFASNLFGSEEEHAGGTLAFASMSWGKHFAEDNRVTRPNHHYDGKKAVAPYKFADAMKLLGDTVDVKPEGYAVDKKDPSVIFIPETAEASRETGIISWPGGQIYLIPGNIYIHPSGYQVALEKRLDKSGWHIVGTVAESMNCHKPSTVSGGGKSEISKRISDMITFDTLRIENVKKDLAYVDMIIKRDYSDRFEKPWEGHKELPLLDPKRTMGSVVKLLTPSVSYTPEYNEWLETVPPYIRKLVLLVKHSYNPEWGKDWKSHVGVQVVDGHDGDCVHIDGKKVVVEYLRVGKTSDKRDRKFMLRHDFAPAGKIQTEDDISASIVVPTKSLEHLNEELDRPAVKMVKNCELRLFQRPDDAIIRGFDTKCEEDMSANGNFMSNFEPLTRQEIDALVKNAVAFDAFTQPMQDRLREAAASDADLFCVSSNNFRIVNGKPTANPRYLQVRTDYGDPRADRVAEIAARLRRRIPLDKPVHFPVQGVLPGRRNNPPDQLADGTPIRPLAVFNPLHYQELPELFMDFVCSLTGKSPSTTGAGSEGALTKGPFNALTYCADLNTTLVGWILSGYCGFSSAAGYIGRHKVEHDISLVVPELWCRMSEEERDPAYLIQHGLLEKVEDLCINGVPVLASRLGYRITARFVHRFFGRIFSNPSEVFDETFLRPETQDLHMFVDGVNNIVEAQAKSGRAYIEDGSIHDACPPLRAVLYCMADNRTPEGWTMDSPELRALFTREHLFASDWYKQRLLCKQREEMKRLNKCIAALKEFIASGKPGAAEMSAADRLKKAEEELKVASAPSYVDSLVGTAGSDPSLEKVPEVAK